MTKYRLRLENGRVIGPFEIRQLIELKQNSRITGKEEAQIFPAGNWAPISDYEFYEKIMDDDRTFVDTGNTPEEEGTFLIDLDKLKAQKAIKDIDELIEETPPLIKEELTETVRVLTEKKENETSTDESLEDEKLRVGHIENLIEAESQNDKTVLNPVAQKEIEKLRREEQEKIEKEKREIELEKREEEEAKQFEVVLSEENLSEEISNEATQVISLDTIELLESAEKVEQEISLEKKKKILQDEKAAKEESKNSVDNKSKKKKWIYIVFAAFLVLAILFPEDEQKKVEYRNIPTQIHFPIPFDVANKNKAISKFEAGVKEFKKGTFPGLVNSGLRFKESFENDSSFDYQEEKPFQKMIVEGGEEKTVSKVYTKLDVNDISLKSLGFMLRSYAEQLNYSKNKIIDIQTVFNIIQSQKFNLIQDPNGVIGLSLFYSSINKTNAAIDVVKKYLKLYPKRVDQDLFAIYIMTLLKSGRVDEAKPFITALKNAKDSKGKEIAKTRYAFEAIIKFHLINEEKDKAFLEIKKATKQFPKDIKIKLLYAEMLVRDKQLKLASALLNEAEYLGLDFNYVNLAKFLELNGLILALQNQPAKAAAALSKSLKLKDSEQLRMVLANLETDAGSNSQADLLIQESKTMKMLMEANKLFEKRSYTQAFSIAAKASDNLPHHIRTELFLSKVQLKLGLIDEGIKTLENLKSKYPRNLQVILALVNGLIDSYKFSQAKKILSTFPAAIVNEGEGVASTYAKLFLKMEDYLQGMSWLKKSLVMNPMDDGNHYQMANLLLKKSKFAAAMKHLIKCMELDPYNSDYQIAYARYIYETKGDRDAIGYLLSLKDHFSDDPKIMSELAIFSYRSGKIKDFMDYKTKMEKGFSKDPTFYDFLIKAAKLDQKNTEIPALVEKVLEIEPGSLEHMMMAGKALFEVGNLLEAAKWFKRVSDKMPTYPQVLYYIAKIDYLSKDFDSAIKKIEENIKANGESDEDLVFLAQIYTAQENKIQAEKLFKKAQKINPKSFGALVGLADLSSQSGNFEMALDLYHRALKLKQEDFELHKKIGDVYRKLGQGALAIEAYKLYLELEPESPYKKNIEAYIKLVQ